MMMDPSSGSITTSMLSLMAQPVWRARVQAALAWQWTTGLPLSPHRKHSELLRLAGNLERSTRPPGVMMTSGTRRAHTTWQRVLLVVVLSAPAPAPQRSHVRPRDSALQPSQVQSRPSSAPGL